MCLVMDGQAALDVLFKHRMCLVIDGQTAQDVHFKHRMFLVIIGLARGRNCADRN